MRHLLRSLALVAALCGLSANTAKAQTSPLGSDSHFGVSQLTLLPFEQTLIDDTQIASAPMQMIVTLTNEIESTDVELGRFVNFVVANLEVVLIDTNTRFAVGSVTGVRWTSDQTGPTTWRIALEAQVEVSGARLDQISRTLSDFFFPKNIQIQVLPAAELSEFARSNAQTLRFRARSVLLMQLALVLTGLLLPAYLLFRRLRRQRVDTKVDPTVSDLEVRLAQANRALDMARRPKGAAVDRNSEDEPLGPPPDIPPALLDAFRDGRAMVAFGAGASAQAGLPTSYQLVFELENALSKDISPRLRENMQRYLGSEDKGQDPDLFSDIMGAVSQQVGRHRLAGEIETIFRSRIQTASTFYDSLAEIPWAGAMAMVWDDLGATAFLQGATPFVEITQNDHNAFRSALNDDARMFVRVWGSLDQPNDVVMSFKDLRQMLEARPEFRRLLTYLLQDRSFLFLGISPSSLREFLETLDPYLEVQPGRHFVLVPESFENELFLRVLRQYGVELIEYDPRYNHAQLASFVDQLRTLAPEPSLDRSEAMSFKRWEPITKLHLHNIGPFDNLEVNFAQSYDPERELGGFPWSVITGPNGSGKSIILRSLSVALAAHDDRIQRQAGSLLKLGKPNGQITVTIGSQICQIDLQRDDGSVDAVRVLPRQQSPLDVGAALILGFPSLRGASTGDPTGPRAMERKPAGARDVYPMALDTVDDRMLDFKQWVVNAHTRAREGDETYLRVTEVLNEIVAQILPGGVLGIVVPSDSYVLRVRVKNPRENDTITEVPFDQMSQGMSSVFNWVGVFLQRVHEAFEDVKDLRKVPATIILDEIDVHLHPAWQRRVVTLVKKTFPRVQIIATTHSSLIVSSIYREEVRVFHEVGSAEYELVAPTSETFGRDATSLMQGETLDVDNARSIEFDALVDRYNTLKGTARRSDPEEEEYIKLRTELREAGWSGILETPAPTFTASDIAKLRETILKK